MPPPPPQPQPQFEVPPFVLPTYLPYLPHFSLRFLLIPFLVFLLPFILADTPRIPTPLCLCSFFFSFFFPPSRPTSIQLQFFLGPSRPHLLYILRHTTPPSVQTLSPKRPVLETHRVPPCPLSILNLFLAVHPLCYCPVPTLPKILLMQPSSLFRFPPVFPRRQDKNSYPGSFCYLTPLSPPWFPPFFNLLH